MLPLSSSKSPEATQARKHYRQMRKQAITESVRGAAIFRKIKRAERDKARAEELAETRELRKYFPRHKADTQTTLASKDFAIELATTLKYCQSDYAGTTLYSLLPPRTQLFICSGKGVVSCARADLEAVPNHKSYIDYQVIANLIYRSYKHLETARAADKQHRTVSFNYVEYLEMIQQLSSEALAENDKLKAIVALLAITGCRGSELAVPWYSVNNRFIRFASPKVTGTNDNAIACLGADLITVKQLRKVIQGLTQPELAKILKYKFNTLHSRFSILAGNTPLILRDTYQCLAYSSLTSHSMEVALKFCNYLGHRKPSSLQVITYISGDIAKGVVVPEMVELARLLRLI